MQNFYFCCRKTSLKINIVPLAPTKCVTLHKQEKYDKKKRTQIFCSTFAVEKLLSKSTSCPLHRELISNFEVVMLFSCWRVTRFLNPTPYTYLFFKWWAVYINRLPKKLHTGMYYTDSGQHHTITSISSVDPPTTAKTTDHPPSSVVPMCMRECVRACVRACMHDWVCKCCYCYCKAPCASTLCGRWDCRNALYY